MAFYSSTGNKKSINLFIQSNNERANLAKFFEKLEDRFFKNLLSLSVSESELGDFKKFNNWAKQIKSDSGEVRVYRIPEGVYKCLVIIKTALGNIRKMSDADASELFESPDSGYNKTLRDFTDNGKIKNSLEA